MLDRFTGYKRLLALAALNGGGASIIERTAIGNPLTFLTDLAKPLVSLEIPFTPQQSGTGDPSPQNIRSIVPWDGLKAQLSGENVLNQTAPQIIDVSGQGVNRYGQVFRSAGKYTIVNNSESYDYLYFKKVKNDLSSYGGANTVNHGQNAKVTLEENYMLYVYRQAGSDMSDFCVNIGEDTVFHAYTGNTYPVSFTSPVYGGTLDVVSGVLTMEWAIVDMGSLRWIANATSTTGIYRMSTSSLSDNIEIPSANSVPGKIVCSAYKTVSADSTYSKVGGIAIGRNKAITVYDADYNTDGSVDDFITAVTGKTIAYKLETPVEIQLTGHQITALIGNNTIWSDADGSMTCVYLLTESFGDEHPISGGLGSGTGEPDEPGEPDQPGEE